jgi:integrase
MKIKLKYVYEPTSGYFYFRKGKLRLPLAGLPGTREFQDAYDDAISQHAPEMRKRIRGKGAAKGTLDWVIIKFKQSDKWKTRAESTREIYERRLDWLSDNYGGELLAAFERRLVKRIRNLPEFVNRTSVADAIVDMIGMLWNFADSDLDIELPGINPTTGVMPRHEEGDAAPAWPDALCKAFEAQAHKRMVTFYMLARFTGQRRGDCCEMKWSDFNQATREMYVAQEKTGTKVWVPAPQRLLDYLRTLPRESDYILTSPKGGPYRATSVTNLVCDITEALGFKTTDSKGKVRGYSPHGLRHLCGAELAEAGCSTRQIMSILGHLTEKQAVRYVEQANRRRMAHDATRLRDRMYERREREAQIEAAPNVTKLVG